MHAHVTHVGRRTCDMNLNICSPNEAYGRPDNPKGTSDSLVVHNLRLGSIYVSIQNVQTLGPIPPSFTPPMSPPIPTRRRTTSVHHALYRIGTSVENVLYVAYVASMLHRTMR